ncbi:MAG: DegT/DnrJ/EryC1/StrS family aminotransferase, partial [Patescibacteria group bacterium]|nr:DegT/DnrJ/EryC1/StrS family aminotransferase [Patescibacteria group bacterium]
GDGGAIITKNKKIYDLCKSLCVYGEKDKYKSRIIAGHSRMPEIQAGILNIFFENIKGDFEKRSKMFKVYLEKIENEKLRKYIRPLISDKKSNPVPHLFVVEAKKRDSLKKFLKEKGIETAIHYPLPVHFVEAFFYLNLKKGEFPVAEKLSKNILSLPFHPYLTYSQVNYIVKTIKDFYV